MYAYNRRSISTPSNPFSEIKRTDWYDQSVESTAWTPASGLNPVPNKNGKDLPYSSQNETHINEAAQERSWKLLQDLFYILIIDRLEMTPNRLNPRLRLILTGLVIIVVTMSQNQITVRD